MIKKRYYAIVIALLLFVIGVRLELFHKKEYRYPFAVCAIFKNEAPWFKEWIDYHHNVLGASHFYLYNNDSSDDYQSVLDPYIQSGLVELIPWESSEEHALRGIEDVIHVPYQLGAYNDCLKKRALGKAEWVAMIDIDEFIVPVQGVESFKNLLAKERVLKTGSLQMYWRVFGHSHIPELQEGELLTEKLTHRAVDSHPWHINMKSIHRPEAIKLSLIHEAKRLKRGYKRKKLSPDLWRIHHYWSRTENYFKQKRNPSPEDLAFYEELSQVEDTTFYQFLPQLKEATLQ